MSRRWHALAGVVALSVTARAMAEHSGHGHGVARTAAAIVG